ncbi:MAG: hypothetical protein RL017_205 [Pseudomonadota bacterium]|nr:glycoside hydrolase family 3 protein [Burkholderiales bacterium]
MNKIETLKQQLLQLIMLDIRYFSATDSQNLAPVTSLNNELQQLFSQFPVGGIILFRENITNIKNTVELITNLQATSPQGMFIAIDQEGGVISRINFATPTLGNMALGAINNLEYTYAVGKIIAEEVKALGFNLNFAPCADVNSNPNNPVIGVRSFGDNPELVAHHAVAFAQGTTDAGVIPCFKHFPGHGDVVTDSHLNTTYLHRTATQLKTNDLVPFVNGINNDIDMIMTAHIIVPDLDKSKIKSSLSNDLVSLPATLSKVIITDLLRQQLKFNGVIISDSLDMQAITTNFTAVEASIMALQAGVDILLNPIRIWEHDGRQKFIYYFNQMLTICENSLELQQKVAQAYHRVINLKQKYKITNKFENINSMLNNAKNIINSPINNKQIEQYVDQAITLSKNTKQTIPWTLTLDDKVLIIAVNEELIKETSRVFKQFGYANLEHYVLNTNSFRSMLSKIKQANKILILTYNLVHEDNELNTIVDYLNIENKPYVVISCRNPYDILNIPKATTNILIYGISGVDITNNYQSHKFNLNLQQAIFKLINCKNIKDFNSNLPISLKSKN